MNRKLLFSFYGILALGIACTFALGWLGLALAGCCYCFFLVAYITGFFHGDKSPVREDLEKRLADIEAQVQRELVKRAFEGVRR